MRNISVLIVSSPKRRTLPLLIKSLLKPGNREYIKEVIITPLQKDKSYEKFNKYLSPYGIKYHVKYICQQRDPLGLCRDKLARISSGRIISFIDDDVILTPKWGKAIYESFYKHSCNVVAGLLLPLKAYRSIIKKSLSRYIARGLTVYNTWFICRSKANLIKPGLIVINPSPHNLLICSSGLWGANLSIEKEFYNKIFSPYSQSEILKLGYSSGKPIGGDDTRIVINSFLKGGRVCLSLKAAAYHITEPYKMFRKYIWRKYSYIAETHKWLIYERGKNSEEHLSHINIKEAFNTMIREILNDISIKPLGVIDTFSIAMLLAFKVFKKNVFRK